MDRVVYLIALAVVSGIRALPVTVCFALGQFVGALMWAILPGYRKLASENLRSAFGNEKSAAEIRRLVFTHFTTLGANFCCAFKMAAVSHEEVLQRTTLEGFEGLNEALRRGKGVVCAFSHLGNWELFAQRHDVIDPYKAATIYQAIRNKHIDDLVNENRRKRGVATFNRKKDLARALAMLKRGDMIVILTDQHAGDSGLWTPFFNRLASTSPLAASLAVRTGAAVIPVGIFTDGFARWRLVAGPEIPYDPANPDQLTADINRALEVEIRRSPADWFWVHNRWKMPHPDFLLARTKRGLYLPPDIDPMSLRPFRILIRSSNWLGDAVMSAPAVRAIKLGRPDARVTILTRDKLADFWRAMPEVDEVIGVPEDAGVLKVAWRIRKRFDVAVLFPNSARSALEAWLAGIPRRVGYLGHKREWMLNQIVPEPKKQLRPRHHAARYMRIAEKMGAPSVPFAFPAAPRPEGPLRIGICPGAEYGGAKRWYPARFRKMMKLVQERVDCTFVVVGVLRDEPIAREVLGGFKGKVEDLVGRTTLAQLIEELRRLHVLVTNDTGTMHLAASLGVPVVALFGSTEPRLTGPLGEGHAVLRHQVECSPCFQRECPLDFRCMDAITAEEVADAVFRIVSASPGAATDTPRSLENSERL
jgi:lipopolysaccharide heptosyltransferase II